MLGWPAVAGRGPALLSGGSFAGALIAAEPHAPPSAELAPFPRAWQALALYMGHSVDMQRSTYDRRSKEQKVEPAVELLAALNRRAINGGGGSSGSSDGEAA